MWKSLLCCFLLFPTLSAQETARNKYFELDNGLRVFLSEKRSLPLVNCVVAVDVGAKDESEEESGLVHILEHLILFRGTEFRSGDEVSQDIRRHGAYFNAHTGRDLSLFEISLPAECADFALENQKEILFHLKLSQEVIDEEKKVILEELSQIQDDPDKYGYSLAYQNLFGDHPYQKPVYGKKEVIEAATVDQIEKFYRKYFVPDNCALAVVGDFTLEAMEEKVRAVFGGLKKGNIQRQSYPKIQSLKKTVEVEAEKDVNQAYLLIGMLGPDFNHPDQYGIDVLTEILGAGVNPLLNVRLMGQRQLAYSAAMGYSSLKYAGGILISIALDPKNLNAAKREVLQLLKETNRLHYSREDHIGEDQIYAFDYLQSAKNQLKFKFHQSQEKGLAISTSLAMYMLLNELPQRGKYMDCIESLSSSAVRKIAGEYLGRGRYVFVSILPKKKN